MYQFVIKFQIKWSNGCTSWVKESFLPSKFVENKTKVKIVEIEEIGQKKKEYRLVEGNSKENDKLQTTFKRYIHLNESLIGVNIVFKEFLI